MYLLINYFEHQAAKTPELVWDYDFFIKGNYLSPLSALLDSGDVLPMNDEHQYV